MALAYDDNGLTRIPLSAGRVAQILDITLDTDYATPGYVIEADDIGFATIEQVVAGPVSGFVPNIVYTDADTIALQVLYGNYDAADGPLIEVVNGLDGIAGLVVRALFIGTPA